MKHRGKARENKRGKERDAETNVNGAACMVLQVPPPSSAEDFPGIPFMLNRGRKILIRYHMLPFVLI